MTRGWSNELWADALAEALGEVVVPRVWWDLPAVGQLTITRPELLDPFETYNRDHPERRIAPANFISVAYPKAFVRADPLRLISPFVSPAEALDAEWYELHSGERVQITTEDLGGEVVSGLVPVKSYGDVAREHVARPERKFEAPDGGPCLRATRGKLHRRHVLAVRFEHLGKEANLLDQRGEGDGIAEELQLVYVDRDEFRRLVVPILRLMPQAEVASAAQITERTLRSILAGSNPSARNRARLTQLAGSWAASLLDMDAFDAVTSCAAIRYQTRIR